VFGVTTTSVQHEGAEESLARRNSALNALHAMALHIGVELEMPVLLHDVMQHATELLDADRGGGIYLYEPDANLLRLVEVAGINAGRTGITVQVTEGVAGRVFRTARPFVIDDYTHWQERATVLAPDPPSTVMGVPLIARGQVLGALLVVADSKRRVFGPEDVTLAEMVAGQAAVAIRNAQLYAQMQEEITERKRAEQNIKQQIKELQLWYDVTLDRETRCLQLKAEVNDLLRRMNEPIRYLSAGG
jgi:GAF domain-containing protein